ncbi:MAG TPA: SRPBCC family protein [Pyrinomonadaceae bacterium]|nr:SRPBCC family protein [Pyrinomonadaceae bacterium]
MSSKPQRGIDQRNSSSANDLQHSTFSSGGANYSVERARPGLPSTSGKRLAKGLGWFSIGLGLAELLAPRAIANISGVSKTRTGLIRLYGLRELASGIAIFSQEKPAEAVWSRVAGDALDLVSLGVACTSPDAKRGRITFATVNVAAVTALDVICAMQLSNGNQGIQAKGTCVVNRPPDEVYTFWRRFENLSRFMRHLESVEDLGDGRSHWTAKGPGGMSVEWDATIIADVPGEVITWRSLENSDVDHAGAVRFERAAGGRGTIVKVNFQYNPIGGVIGATVAKLFGEEPEQQLDDDLRRFKQVMEVGEVVVSDATLLGTGYMEQRPGRPAAASELEQADQLPSQTATNYGTGYGSEGRMTER